MITNYPLSILLRTRADGAGFASLTHASGTDSRLAGGSAPGPLAASQHLFWLHFILIFYHTSKQKKNQSIITSGYTMFLVSVSERNKGVTA
jgi:hypothetical protein